MSVRAALAAPAAGELAAEGEAAQLDLIPAGRRLSAEEARKEGELRRGRGRPKGAENLMTRDLRKWVLQSGELPQRALMLWAQLSPEELAERLGCTKLEAFDRWLKVQAELGPYFMPKLAPTDMTGAAVPPIALFIGGEAANVAGARAPWQRTLDAVAEVVEIQGVSGIAAGETQAAGTQEDGNT